MADLRIHFRDELAQLERQALGGLDMVVEALSSVLDALARLDIPQASMVVADDDRIDGRYLEVHQGVLSLLARQTPVASDLRLVAALLHLIRHVERMGDQCVTIAKMIPLDGMEAPVNDEIVDRIERMGVLARTQILQARKAFEQRDVVMAEALVTQDDQIDDLNREIFRLALEIGDDLDTREWAMHMILVARALERIADNAVDIGEQTAFIVTGLFREFTDASHPVGRLTEPPKQLS
jgi:phosphate transport system protein